VADLTPSAQTRWEARVEMLHANPAGQDCVYIGEHALDGTPVILRRAALKDHALIVGSTGSRKTSLSVGPFLSQLLYMQDIALVIIDAKGDAPLFHTLRLLAAHSGRPFRWVTPLLGQASYCWNPLANLYAPDITLEQSVQSLIEAVMDIAPSTKADVFFALMNTQKVRTAIRSGHVEHLRDLHAACSRFDSDYDRQTASEIVAILEGLATVKVLNLSSPEGINLKQAIAGHEIVYFWLPASREPQTVKLLARLAIFDLFQNASVNTPCFVAIDEAARVASPTLSVCLEQARGLGLSFLLSCQTLPADPAFRQTLLVNSSLKLFNDLQGDTAGWLTDNLGVMTFRRASSGIPLEVPLTKTPGVYHEINNDPSLAILALTRDVGPVNLRGYPIPLRLEYQMSEAEYQRRSDLPFPTNPEEYPGTIVATRDPSPTLSASTDSTEQESQTREDDETVRRFDERAKKYRERFDRRKKEDPE
jgi:hypothetical protein